MNHPRLKKAEAHLRGGRTDKAEKELERLLGKDPTIVPAWLMIASVYGRSGRYDRVANAARKVIALDPKQAAAYSLLGSASVYLGCLDDAIDALETANRLQPGNTGMLNNLGNTWYAAQQFGEAERYYRQALAADPDYPQSHFGLANCLLVRCRWTDAIDHFCRARDAMSDSYDIHFSLGKAYMNLACSDEAVECLERAAALADDPGAAWYELAHVEQLRGDLDRAGEWIGKALARNPLDHSARAKLAEIDYKAGRVEAAHAQIETLVAENAITPVVVLAWGQFCHRYDECAEVIRHAQALLADERLGLSDCIALDYLLGALHDKRDEYDAAFAHYHEANTALAGDFDRDGMAAMVDSLVQDYAAAEHMPNSGIEDERPVFIVGMPRSGTSLVEQILASHPAVHGAGELGDIKQLAGELVKSSPPKGNGIFSSAEPARLAELAGRYLEQLESRGADAARVTEKMPANFLWSGFIRQLFPRARILHCIRDPRDTCLSIYFQQFTKSHEYANDLADLAFYYRQYRRLMEHWRAVGLPLLDVHYRDLVRDTENTARRMIDYLGLPWDDRCLDYHESTRAAATASWDQVRRPVYTRSLGRWKYYEQHLGPLLDAFGDDEHPAGFGEKGEDRSA